MTTVPVLTVEQLIAKLQKVEDKSTVVYVDGCDCGEMASHVYPDRSAFDASVKYICIGRADQHAGEDPEKRGDL